MLSVIMLNVIMPSDVAPIVKSAVTKYIYSLVISRIC